MVGSTMIASTSGGGQQCPGRSATCRRTGSSRGARGASRRAADEWNDHEDAPQAVDDAGNRRQQLDRDLAAGPRSDREESPRPPLLEAERADHRVETGGRGSARSGRWRSPRRRPCRSASPRRELYIVPAMAGRMPNSPRFTSQVLPIRNPPPYVRIAGVATQAMFQTTYPTSTMLTQAIAKVP